MWVCIVQIPGAWDGAISMLVLRFFQTLQFFFTLSLDHGYHLTVGHRRNVLSTSDLRFGLYGASTSQALIETPFHQSCW